MRGGEAWSAAAPVVAREDAAETLVSLRGVGKTFANGVTALADMNLHVRAGEFLTLLGPSGCGKSTVLRMIAGLTRPSSGTIIWGAGVGGEPAQIGFVFQEPTLTPWSNVFANVRLPLRLRGVSRKKAQARVEEALSLVGLEGFAKAFPRELSGGMKMRVSIARALVTRPSLLLMDEPFAALDEITRWRMNDDLLQLKQSLSATILFVTHSVYESVYLSDRILVLASRPGRVAGSIESMASFPRADDFRVSPSYLALCREVSRVLRDAATPEDRL